jgi:benzoyl-CoA reductase/2-hydroxyglutaryl-CoA dehydratase subunit BcrC/BadD/HgdB
VPAKRGFAWSEETGINALPELVDVMISTGQILCDPRSKWYQASQQFMPDVPIYNIDLPHPLFQRDQDHREVWGYYHKYIVKQLRGLVAFLEEQTGKKMDYDRLKGLVDLSDRTWNLIEETYSLRKAVPCPMGTGDAMNTMVPINFMMATQKAYDFFVDLKKELEEKIAKKEGEDYTYGQYLETQIEEVIRMYKYDGHATNQAYMTVGDPRSIFLKDPPCLRGIDTRIKDGRLHFIIYFRK